MVRTFESPIFSRKTVVLGKDLGILKLSGGTANAEMDAVRWGAWMKF
jgi:hypothetical protein